MMLRTRWQKVLIDLWRNRARTLIVALAVAVGVFAVGFVVNVREMLLREYGSDQDGALVAAAILHTEPFDDDLAERIAEVPGVAAAEGRRVVRTRVYHGGLPRGVVSDDPLDLLVTAIPDFETMQVDALTPLQGNWPPGKREIILERMALDYLGVGIGDTITVELDNDVQKELSVVGTVHDAQQLSPDISERATGYVTPETVDALGLGEYYTELRLRVTERADDETHVQGIVDRVEDQLERGGREVLSTTINTESYVRPFIDAVVLILSSFGLLVLLLSGFLVVNAISALITQQIPQIGIMKLVGARRLQITSLYIATVLVYGLIAIIMGMPLSILAARLLMSELVEGLLNVMSDSYAVSMPIIALQMAVGLLLPLLAGLVPVIRGTRITTQAALNDVGVQAGAYGRGWVERLLEKLQRIKGVQRPILLAIRNTLRHRGRLAQTLLVLIVGTALFISVLSVWASVNRTLDGFMLFHQYDVSVEMERPYRITRLEQAAWQVPGVAGVEGWSLDRATRLRPDDTESETLRVYAVPADSEMIEPEISAGQWLPAAGGNAIVINSDVVEKEPDLKVGEEVVLDIGGREAVWQVVGIVPTESKGPAIYMVHDDYAYVTRRPGQATHLQVVTGRHPAGSRPPPGSGQDGGLLNEDVQQEMATALFQHLEAQGFQVSGTQTAQAINSSNELMFTLVVIFLVLMALLLAAVGGLGLTTTMSINILERVREIGVLRAVGASNVAVRQIVVAEGVVIGLLSWGIGAILSLPISSFMSEQVGLALIDVPLSFQYSVVAAVVWFFALLLVAVAASLGPARSAVRLTIREVLAYE